MDSTGKKGFAAGQHFYRKRRRNLISCIECHRRKQKCDRRRPCQNCLKRGKPELCLSERTDSETCNNTAVNLSSASSGQSRIKPSTPWAHPTSQSKTNDWSPQDHRHLAGTLGYSTHNVHNTFGLVDKVGTFSSSISSPLGPLDVFNRNKTAFSDKYRSVVRQLPSKEYNDILIKQFFSEINWQYDVLDEITFRRQLESWRRFPYSAHSQAIDSLPADMLAFPALVFQLMAQSLTHQPVSERAGSSLESLKYASGMTFVDLAYEFSDAGYSMIETLEKKDMSVVAVQSGILRASFLKNTGSVTEAWHVIGTTIRNAQEIGMHASVAARDPSVSIDAQWDHEMRRRVWFVLHNWDIHMAVVLGRPILTTMATEIVGLPDDFAQRESGQPPRRRTDSDSPTPFSVIRIGYDVAYQYFPRVRELENRGARIEDYNIVRETHAAIVQKMDQIPLWCRHDDSDIHFDGFPGCHWLPAARQALTSGIYFVLLSLHRPFIFSVPESRTQALKAALMVFTTQRRLFDLSKPEQYLTFNMVYPLFDAMVISLAIHVLFPNENWDVQARSVENVHWGIDILTKIGQYNVMARSANGVVKTLLSRLAEGHGYSLQHSSQNSEEDAVESLDAGTTDPRAFDTSSNICVVTDISGAPSFAESLSLTSHQARPTASRPLDFDGDALLPPRPVGDLFSEDFYPPFPEAIQGDYFPDVFLPVDGNYSDDSFWNFINDLGHM